MLNLPYLFDDRDHVFTTLDGPVGEDLLALLEDIELKGLAFGEFGFRSMMTAPRPINVPADLNGIKIRVPESDLYINTMELLGATPTPIPGPEIFTSLQNGVVDATEAPIFAAVTQKYYETPPGAPVAHRAHLRRADDGRLPGHVGPRRRRGPKARQAGRPRSRGAPAPALHRGTTRATSPNSPTRAGPSPKWTRRRSATPSPPLYDANPRPRRLGRPHPRRGRLSGRDRDDRERVRDAPADDPDPGSARPAPCTR